jgi:serine/threonine-protein kinase TTK/MPS1
MAPNRKIFALKRIKLTGRDAEAASGFIDEISLLQRLRAKSNIIQLVDAEVMARKGTDRYTFAQASWSAIAACS